LFAGTSPELARALLGAELLVDGVGGIIAETEAYAQYDEASHTFRGQTKRNAAMFDEPGTVYVYFTYGMHVCMNFSAHSKGVGEGVLIRAIEPTRGLEEMWQRRFKQPMPDDPPHKRLIQLTNGPAKLCQALGVTLADNHERANKGRFHIIPNQKPDIAIMQTTRVGISRAADRPWRWYVAGNAWVSKL